MCTVIIVFLLLPSIGISYLISPNPIIHHPSSYLPSISTKLFLNSDKHHHLKNNINDNDDEDDKCEYIPSSNTVIARKSWFDTAKKITIVNSLMYYLLNNRVTITSAIADDKISSTMKIASTVELPTDKVPKGLMEIEPEITDKVYLDVKIANYTEESVGKNKGAFGSGRLVIGLYGKVAPLSCKIFLDTIRSDGSLIPSYRNSQLSRITEEGLIEIEKIRGLNTVLLAGTDQYEYDGNLMDYKPILESNGIKHARLGLLSRRQLSSTPEFGITLKPSSELDSFHVVFGTILEGKEVKILSGHCSVYQSSLHNVM